MPSRCLTLVEIVNLPSRFVCTNPYVVDNTDWIMWYVLVTDTTMYWSLTLVQSLLIGRVRRLHRLL